MSKVKLLTRDAILKADDIKTEKVEVPEWGGAVYVRGMAGYERDQYEQSLVQQRGRNQRVNIRNARARLVALCTVDDKGSPIFTENDISALGRKSAKALDRLFHVAQDLSGISEDDLDELTKNSEEMIFDD